MKYKFPKAKEIVNLVIKKYGILDINELHGYLEILSLKSKIYENEISNFLKQFDLPENIFLKIKNKILEPIEENQVLYINFLEKIARPVIQAVQPLAGSIAELCAIQELIRVGLKDGMNFKRRVERTDLVIYFPTAYRYKKKHRIEVKNVSLRERATRGLKFDGDSLLGFFNDPGEFTEENIKIIENLCREKNGYCYIPPKTLKQIKYKTERFKSNMVFAEDMKHFCKTGVLP